MAQEIKRRLFSSRKVLAVLLVLTLLGAALLALTVFAQNDKVTITVSDAEGFVGDKVWVEISISGIPNVCPSDTGITGGKIQIPYNASIADVEKSADIRRGALLSTKSRLYPDDDDDDETQDDFIFLANNDDGGDILTAAWMSNIFPDDILRYIRDDGVLVRVQFALNSIGTFELALSDLELNPVLGDAIPSSSIIVNSGTITVLGTELPKVGQPTWDGDVIKWVNVENAEGYEVKLYKGGTVVDTQPVNQGTSSYNFGSKIASLAPGVFTVTVQAKGDSDPWTDGAVSEPSAANTKTEVLAKVGKPVWDGWAVTWTDVENAAQYEVILYRGEDDVVTKAVEQGLQRYDFSADTGELGSYTATVQAKGDGVIYLDGLVSDPSDSKERRASLAQVEKPTWDQPGKIQWGAVEHAAKYKVELLKNGEGFKTETTTDCSYNFLDEIREDEGGGEGSYTVKVTALADEGGLYDDGPASEPSAARVAEKLVVTPPSLSAYGEAFWSDVANAEDYIVQLYKDGGMVESATESGLSYGFLSTMRDKGSGDYTVTVSALGTGLYLNSDESAPSEPAVTVSRLKTPDEPAWQSDDVPVLSWNSVTGATGYKVQLYKSGVEEGSPVQLGDVDSHDFTGAIGDVAGHYTARVQPLGDDYLLLDGSYSAHSPVFTKTGPLGQVKELALSDRGVATWVDEPDAVAFEVQLYKDGEGAIGDPRTVEPGVQSADFRDAMRGAGVGDYYVSVTAIAEDGSLFSDGNLFNSNDQTVSKLDAPTNVELSNQGVSSWSAVANATRYSVTLTLPAGHPSGSAKTDTTAAESMNHLAVMRQHPGDYKVTVTVQDTVGLFLDSDGADSGSQTVIKLGKAAKPGLSDMGEATWTAVDDATEYTVALYKGSALVVKKTVASTITSYDYLSEIKKAGAGKYTVTVTALGDEYLVLDGEPSPASDPVTVKVLQKMSRPGWAIDELTDVIALEWEAVTGATNYEITIYNGSGEDPVTVIESGSTYTFTPPEAGFYWATIRALGSGVTLDGPISGYSDILAFFGWDLGILALDPPANDHVASGRLPVPGYLWMQITSETGTNGIMKVQRGSTSAYDVPEGLTAAGIFFEIEFDENLSGSHVLLEAGYDPAALPQWMKEASLRFYRYDAEKGWELLDSSVDTDQNIVSAEIDHFSTIGLFGEVSAPPVDDEKSEVTEDKKPEGDLPRTYGYIPYLLLGGIALALAGLFFFRRRKGLEGR